MSAAVTLAPVLDAALRARDAGISVMPIAEDGSKAPAVGTWKRHMRSIPSEEEIRYRFASSTGLAFVCGQVSGGLECLDFDKVDAFDAFVELCRASGNGDLVERVMDGYHERSPRGVHLLYRCSSPRSTKLAKRREEGDTKAKAIIETKGEGGYVIVAPSHGGVHPEGVYELVRGSIEAIVTLTDDEREALHAVARALNEDVRPAHVEPELEPAPDRGERPGDEWARMTSWAEILEPHGWVRLWTRGPITYWRRPGKSQGISATTNYAESDLLYVFTTSTDFEANRGYGKFGAYALLEHRGDFRAASRCLRDQGYGQPYRSTIEGVDLSALTAKPKAKANPSKAGGFPEHLFDVPGLVGELHRYIVASAPKPQPILALGAAVCAIGTLVGRKVEAEDGTRTNIYVAALAETGAGKEWPRKAIRRAFRAINLEPMVAMESPTGDAAIYGNLQDHPACLWAADEFGYVLAELKERKGNNIIPTIMKLWGIADDACFAKTYARDRRTNRRGNDVVIYQPNLSIYATSVPSRFWESLSSAESIDGFLNRFLVLTSEDQNPPYRRVLSEAKSPPASLVTHMQRWKPSLGYMASLGGDETPATPPPDPTVARMGTGAEAALADISQRTHAKVGELQAAGSPEYAALFVRTAEYASRLALVRAAGQGSPDDVVIARADIEWGAELAWWCAEHALSCVRAKIGDSEHDVRCKQVVAWLEARGGMAQRRELTRRFQSFGPALRDVLTTLLDSEQIVQAKGKSSGGRPPLLYALPSTSGTSDGVPSEEEMTDVP